MYGAAFRCKPKDKIERYYFAEISTCCKKMSMNAVWKYYYYRWQKNLLTIQRLCKCILEEP
ncbi:MAG: hypothetical protein RL275_2788 [Chloroflexota bacterium]|jgi:hypothetical protein